MTLTIFDFLSTKEIPTKNSRWSQGEAIQPTTVRGMISSMNSHDARVEKGKLERNMLRVRSVARANWHKSLLNLETSSYELAAER